MKVSKGILLLSLILFTGVYSHAQIKWLDSFSLAKEIAKAQNKLIIVDCWATWCGPCERMNSDVWDNEAMNSYADKYVFVKIDVSSDFANPDFTINAIPKVFVVDAWNHQYQNYTGYKRLNTMKTVLDEFMFDCKDIYKLEKNVREDDNDINEILKLAMSYQEIYEKTEYKTRFLMRTQSNHYFKLGLKKLKKNKNKELSQKVELLASLNKNPKKRLKDINSVNAVDENIELLRNAILVKTYVEIGDKEKAQELFAKVKDYNLPYYDFLSKERVGMQ
ncbi:thioredoxin family protein [Marinifilum sp. RC60d5]|uniref:thioredoxin family protein n=1 Tax=Marinifilum sp. RC60d5 TaxID=3458414 RepID=UPI004036BB28